MSIAKLPGLDLHYLQFPATRPGRADPADIVMVHGMAASSAFWYGAGATRLSVFGRVTLYDLRGHGRSDMPSSGYTARQMGDDLEALMDELGILRAHLVAHSFGGLVALQFALRHRERVSSLILADVRASSVQAMARRHRRFSFERSGAFDADFGSDRNPRNLADGVAHLERFARIRLQMKNTVPHRLAQRDHAGPARFFSQRSARRWLDLLERTTLKADVRDEEPLSRRQLNKIEQPTLVLVGTKSSTVASCRTVAREIPGAILKEIPDVGHFFPITRPARFLRPTARFLRRFAASAEGTARTPPPPPTLVRSNPLSSIRRHASALSSLRPKGEPERDRG